MVSGTVAQLTSSGMSQLTVKLTDPDAKSVMTRTPNVTMTVNSLKYKLYEMNPTMVPNVYLVTLQTKLINGIEKDTTVTFEG